MDYSMKAEKNGLSLASFVFGILAVLGSFVVVPTPFFASMAICFAWLSRGKKKMNWQAAAGNVLAVVSILISIAIVLLLIAALITYLRDYVSQHATELAPILDGLRDLIEVRV